MTKAPPKLLVRAIEDGDERAIAEVIRTVMTSLGCDGPGFAMRDDEVSFMARAYAPADRAYFVALSDGVVVGGAGIAPLEGGAGELCELRKMYILPSGRGLGLGRRLLDRCLQSARELGYQRCYLETLERMTAARGLYESFGFKQLEAPLGDTGHFSCDNFYLLEL